jgi:N-methylhydantoinase B
MSIALPKLSEITGVVFDGVKNPYVPPKELTIHPSLKLHRDAAREIDPVTYEVIRHNLWNINEEHGSTIQRISGSPVAVYAIDLNPSILTEDAEFVYFGPFMQYMSGVTDTQVKWTLEFRSGNPGIRPGDMFIANDPWVGAAHQQDVMLLCPVFHGDELFCWVTNCLHQYDVGGVTPGSFCIPARDVYDEGLMLPPTKIVEGGEVRKDIEAIYLRASRRPDMVALDLRAQIAGNKTAAARIHKLIARYGHDVVKGVMRKVIDNGEKAFLKKMEGLPDGVWQERTYVECAFIGDRNVYPVMTRLRKNGTELTFENDGTAPQIGGMNCTYSGWRGSTMVVINQLLCWDQYFAIGGALRHVKFDPTPGTFTCANFPAAVSTAPIQAMEIALYPVYNVLSRMIYPDAKLRPDILCMSGASQMPVTMFSGIDQYGDSYGYGMIDPMAGAIGAFAVGDGINTGGQSRTPISKIPNVEFTEYQFPLLYLYRKEVVDSGGAGRWRGGLSGVSCFVPHNTTEIVHEPLCSGVAVPSSIGMMGGYPSTGNRMDYVRGSDVQERFRRGELVGDIQELSGEQVIIPLRDHPFPQTPHDAFAITWCGGGGFGDPTKRDPALVEADLKHRAISIEAAQTLYACIVDPTSLAVDRAATDALRARLRSERLQRFGAAPAGRSGGTPVFEATPEVHVHRDDRGLYYACAGCGTGLSALSENYKDHVPNEEGPVSDGNPLIGDPEVYVDNPVAFRRFYCPACANLLDTEVVVDNAPPNHDLQFSVEWIDRRHPA